MPPPSAQAAIPTTLERLAALRRDARDLSLPLPVRRRAADTLLDGLRDRVSARPSDPMAAIWLADAAEECFISVLPLGGDLDTVLYSLAAHEEWRRVGATVAVMIDLTQRAESAASKSVAALSNPETPLDAERAALLDRLEVVEIPRRIPLLAGISQSLAAIVLDVMPEARRERGRSALLRLLPLLEELDGEARWHAAIAAMLASGAADDAEAFAAAHTAALDASGGDADLRRRSEMAAALSEAQRGDLDGAIRRVRTIASTHARAGAGSARGAALDTATGIDPDLPRRLAEFEARLKLDAKAPPAEWVAPLVEVVATAPPGRRAAWRDAMLVRLADAAASDPSLMHGDPRLDLAAALAESRVDPSIPVDPAAAASTLLRARAALDRLAPDDPWRSPALELVARLEGRRGRFEASVDALLELAERFRAEPRSAEAIDRAVRMAEALDAARPADGADDGGIAAGADSGANLGGSAGSDAQLASESSSRHRLRRALDLGIELYPDVAARSRWRVQRVVLDAERMASSGAVDPASRAALESKLANIRPILNSPPPDDDGSFADLQARLALAMSVTALNAGRADDALAALERAVLRPSAPEWLAERLLERRLEALAMLDRDLEADPQIAGWKASQSTLRAATLRTLQRRAPPLDPGEERSRERRPAAAVRRLVALLESLHGPPRADPPPTNPPPPTGEEIAALRLIEAESLRAVGEFDAAATIYDTLLARSPNRSDLLLGQAECLAHLARAIDAPPEKATDADRDRLSRAATIYQRLIADREFSDDPAKRDSLWWLCHLRQIEIHRRAGGDAERIAARVAMLRALDPSLGGPRFAPRFEAMAGGARSPAETAPARR